MVDRAVGVHQEHRERQIEVETQIRDVDVTQVGAAHGDVRRRGHVQLGDATTQLAVEVAAVSSSFAAEDHEQWSTLLCGEPFRRR
ncbi:MAG: hypothetical protein NXI31_02840 [bacterium]|nr:hypothetical protein [bacterium]